MKVKSHKIYLGFASLTLIAVGSYIGLAPGAYFTSFNPGTQPPTSFLSELRGMGGGLLMFGMLALCAIKVSRLEVPAVIAATLVFSAFACFRLLSIMTDGIPGESILAALVIEFLLAAFGLRTLREIPDPA